MTAILKKIIKSIFLPLGYKINVIQAGEKNKYGWLKEYSLTNIIDIGANTGQFATEIHEWFPSVRIDCFEPIQAVYKQLNLNTSGISEIFTHNFAIGAEDGILDIHFNEFTPASSFRELTNFSKSSYSFASATCPEQVQVRQLDALHQKGVVKIDRKTLVKLDVQGYETEVIKGGRNALSQSGIILCEVCFIELYRGQALVSELVRMIEELGFELRGVWNIDQSSPNGFPVFGDAIFFRREK